jgi:hypothetical protein
MNGAMDGLSHYFNVPRNGEDLSIFCTDEKFRYTESVLVEKKHARIVEEEPSSDMRFEVSKGADVKATIFSEETVTSVTRSTELSIEWTDEQINAGGRVLPAIVRPYPIATPGTPISLQFNMQETYLLYSFEHNPITRSRQPVPEKSLLVGYDGIVKCTSPPTSDLNEWAEIYLPRLHFPTLSDIQVAVSNGHDGDISCDGEWIINTGAQRLWFRCCCHGGGGGEGGGGRGGVVYPRVRHEIVVRRRREGDMKKWGEGVMKGGWGCGCGIM